MRIGSVDGPLERDNKPFGSRVVHSAEYTSVVLGVYVAIFLGAHARR